ncbi:MAG: DnaB-like helicase C-terminal domain-containing protein [bacterium]|nr:DnaB-like helicase C-terminal domain-containing protein [bacterium]
MDAKILNILINSKKELAEFNNSVGENVFAPKYRRFARQLCNYYKTYMSCPTLETLREYCSKNNNELDAYLNNIWNEISEENTDIREYGFLIKKISKRYNVNIIKSIGDRIENVNEDNVEAVNDSVLRITSEIKNIGSKKSYKEIILNEYTEQWKQSFFAKVKNKELAQGVMTGYSMFDYYTNGLRKGELLLIGGDTGGGKSIFLIDLAVNCFIGKNYLPSSDEALSNFVEKNIWDKAYNVLYISLEMPAEEVADRILSKMATINNLDIMKGIISSEEAGGIKRALYYWENSPYKLNIVDMPRGCSMDSIQSIFEETKMEFMPDIVIIDYLGLMIDNEGDSDADHEKLRIVSEEMHEFGRVNEVAVVSAVQLTVSKQGEGGIGIHRIGRSRAIAHNANIFLQIEQREDEDMRSDFRLHMIKFRRGPKIILNNLRKEFQYTRLVDLGFKPEKDDGKPKQVNEDLSDIITQIFGEEKI